MFINQDTFFIHIPKNGGTFVRNLIKDNIDSSEKNNHIENIIFYKYYLLKNRFTLNFLKKKDIANYLKQIEQQHKTIREIHPILMKLRDKKIGYFCVFRDPIDRFKSLYIQTIKRQKRNKFNKLLKWSRKKKLNSINIENYIDFLIENPKNAEIQAEYIDFPEAFSKDISKIELIKINDLTNHMKTKFNLTFEDNLDQDEYKNRLNTRYSHISLTEANNKVSWDLDLNLEYISKLKHLYKKDFAIWDSL